MIRIQKRWSICVGKREQATFRGAPCQQWPSRNTCFALATFSPLLRETTGVVSTARIERPPLHRGGSVSKGDYPGYPVHPRPLEPAETVLPESGRILFKDSDRICLQDPPPVHKHLSFQLPRGPCGKSDKSPEGFGRLGLCNGVPHRARESE